jgi:hypothetical protein
MTGQQDNRSLGELFGALAQDTGTLVRQEVELAKTEMTQKATRVGKDIGFLLAGGAVAYAGFLGILAAIAIGLGQLGMPWWLAALLVGVVVAAIGGFLVMRGLSALRQETAVPQQTIDTLKEDAEWAKTQTQ